MTRGTPVAIGGRLVGDGQPCFLIAEIGINHNGDVEIAKQLIDLASQYGYDAVKFQKRTLDAVYTKDDLDRPRESPFGTTNRELKQGLEFGKEEYDEIDAYCKSKQMLWFASPWDEGSVDFLEAYDPCCYKVASASLTDRGLLSHIAAKKRPVLLSTGMSTLEEISEAVDVLAGVPTVLLHCTSTYPADLSELNLAVIPELRQRFGLPVGYSGHESGVNPSVMAVAVFDACAVERHVTLNRAMWGSDQSASIEPRGMELLSRDVRAWPTVRGDGKKRVYESEVPIREKLRRVG